MVTKEQVKKCLDKYANDYLSTREETECFDYAIKAVDAYNEPNDAVIDVVHKTIYGFFDVVADDSEEPMSEKDKLLLEVNKAVCNAVKEMPDDERKTMTHEEAVGFLQASGWLQDHDKQIYEQEKRDGIEERKTGKWIPHYSGYRQYNGYDCSLCGGWCIGQKKYCGECGAKMEGAEE